MPAERRGQAIAFEIGSTGDGRNPMFNGRRQPSCGGTSRMMREYQVRICERLGVKFPEPTRPSLPLTARTIHSRNWKNNGPQFHSARPKNARRPKLLRPCFIQSALDQVAGRWCRLALRREAAQLLITG